MTERPKPQDEADIERLIEAQARGEDVRASGTPVDDEQPKDAELHSRISKGRSHG